MIHVRFAFRCVLLALIVSAPIVLYAQPSEQKLTASDGSGGDAFGISVSVDVDVAIIGAIGDNAQRGSAYVYRRVDGSWVEEQKLVASDGTADDWYGVSVSISGNVAVVGAYRDDDHGTDSGAAYVYRRVGGVWIEEQKLTASDGSSGDRFAISVSLASEIVLVGADQWTIDGTGGPGSAYVYRNLGGSWVEEQKLVASDGSNSDSFGSSVSLTATRAIIGARHDDDHGSASGSAYIYRDVGGFWEQEQKLTASDGASGHWFGQSVSVSGDVALIGAVGTDEGGAAYVYQNDNGVWILDQRLSKADGVPFDFYGDSVSISGELIVIGAFGVNDFTGEAYVYRNDDGSWTEDEVLMASDASEGDWYGYSVSVSDNMVLVGSYFDFVNGSQTGSAYVYELAESDPPPIVQPKLTLSSALIEPGQSVQIEGANFSSDGTVTLIILGPSGFSPVIESLVATSTGLFSYTFQTDESTPQGYFGTFARDDDSDLYTLTHTFQVTSDSPPPSGDIAIVTPEAGAEIPSNQSVQVTWNDFIAEGSAYPPPEGAYRYYDYTMEYSVDGGAWTAAGNVAGLALLGQTSTFSGQVDPAPGSVEVRITDAYDISRSTTSGVFTVRDVSSDAATISLEWDYSFPTPTNLPVGVASDGVGRLYLRVEEADPSTIAQVDVALSNAVGSTSMERLGRVMPATITSEYSDEANAANSTTASTSTRASDSAFWFWYTAPDEYMGLEMSTTRTIFADVTVHLNGGGSQVVRQEILVTRPPLMLVHGLGSDPTTWDEFSLMGNGVGYAEDGRFIKTEAAPIYPGGSFEQSGVRLLTSNPESPLFARSFRGLLRRFRAEGYAANRVLYVGHSMGGNVLRAAEDRGNYYNSDNYDQGFVSRAVTLQTPHHGTPLANLIEEYVIAVSESSHPIAQAFLTYMIYLYDANPGLSVFSWVQPNGSGPLANGFEPTLAILNLKEEGGVRFGATPIPTHLMTADLLPGRQSLPEIPESVWLTFDTTEEMFDVFDHLFDVVLVFGPDGIRSALQELTGLNRTERVLKFLEIMAGVYSATVFVVESDGVVGLESQLAGLSWTSSQATVKEGITYLHHHATSNPSVGATIGTRLEEPANSIRFGDIPAAPPGRSLALALETQPGGLASVLGGDLSITEPAEGTSVSVGDLLRIRTVLADTTGLQYVKVYFQGQSFVSTAANHVHTFDLTVGPNRLESQPLQAVAVFIDGDASASFAEVDVSVVPSGVLNAFTSRTPLYNIVLDDVVYPQFEALYDTYLSPINSTSGLLTVTIADSDVVEFDSESGGFIAQGGGHTTATVTYGGLSTTLGFSVDAGDGTGTDIEGGPSEVPEEPALTAVFPNPFHSSVTVRYDVSEVGQVRITLFDILGRQVARPVDSVMQPGRYQSIIDAQQLSSGIYFVRMETGNHRETRTITLLR